MSKVWDFIQQFEGRQHEVMVYFHHVLTMDLNLEEKIRFGIPFYFGRSWICYLNPIKNHKVELAFVRGNELSNIQGLLDNKGRKQVYSIEFEKVSDIPESVIHEIIQEAILLDETTSYESKRKSGKK
jgi:filamentous hemagglutinin family protein